MTPPRDPTRNDRPELVAKHQNLYKGGKALVVLGGPSATKWEKYADRIKPDVIIGANGVNQVIPDLNYWLCTENMSYPQKMADEGEQRYIDIMKMYQLTGATWRFVNRITYKLIEDKTNLVATRRQGVELGQLKNFNFREYGEGFINGARMQRPRIVKDLRAGTVGLQCIHLAGILGVAEVHTIGYDLMFPPGKHHWYKYPLYAKGRFWGENMFTEWKGVKTTWFWVDTVEYMKHIEPILEKDGIIWTDHSHGLLEVEELECTKR